MNDVPKGMTFVWVGSIFGISIEFASILNGIFFGNELSLSSFAMNGRHLTQTLIFVVAVVVVVAMGIPTHKDGGGEDIRKVMTISRAEREIFLAEKL